MDLEVSYRTMDPDPSQFTYKELKGVSELFNERNDCTVIATCVVTNSPYPMIHEMFRKRGRRRRCGCMRDNVFSVLTEMGYRIKEVTISYPGRTVRAVVPQLPKDGRFLIGSSRHITGVVNGKAECWAHEGGLFVQGVWQVLDTHEPDPDIVIRADLAKGRWSGAVQAQAAIRAFADRQLAARLQPAESPPFRKKWWLGLRASVMAECERHGIKRTTASIELGKWQAELGYSMTRLT